MALQKLFNQSEDVYRKIDMLLRREDLSDFDAANRSVNDLKTLLTSAKKFVILFFFN